MVIACIQQALLELRDELASGQGGIGNGMGYKTHAGHGYG